MSIGYDIVVDDGKTKEIARQFERLSSSYEERLKLYLASLNRVTQNALKKGSLAENLSVFEELAKTLEDETKNLSETVNIFIENFISDMDEADSYLY